MSEFQTKGFHPVILLPEKYEVYDFTSGYNPNRKLESEYGVGKFKENRKGMYTTPLFNQGETRTIHMGVDLAAPVNTPVHAFWAGEVFMFGYNGAEGDYGYTLITKHYVENQSLFVLHGHLSKASIQKQKGQKFQRGEIIAWVGDKHENGGWNPHLHFQVSIEEPKVCDMPGAVSEKQLEQALKIYLDPLIFLGPLY